jgi:spermidine synthase
VRAVESASDVRRRNLGILYGTNTLGAVAGTLATTFVSLEHLGARATIWSASALNLAVALAALALARRSTDDDEAASPRPLAPEPAAPATPPWLVLTAAGAAGFAFLVMELVWYRMLAPLLGGSSYTFGLILAVALLGIGVGGLAYAATGGQRAPTLHAFAFTCALEAACIAAPYALGDRMALFALAERQGVVGFGGLVWGWLLVTLAVVFPGAAVSGYQFPLLVGLLGKGQHRVGEDVGRVYAINTLGAIAGSLAGGFGLMPLLTAPGAWRAVVYVLVALSALAAAETARADGGWRRGLPTAVVAAMAVAFCLAQGPTAFWRHSPIGAGRVRVALADPNAVQRALNKRRLEILWDADGVESSVTLDREDGLAFYVNGKSDGNAIGDAPTQVMLGLIGAMLHPDPKRALVIGLGTGETAGWLAQIPSIERVDVFELEPTVVRVAEACASTNGNVLRNPKVRVVFGDARELLLTTRDTYDVIASEPSNPYRAGTASLFTREFYEAAAARLRPAGVFMQWVQAYEVRASALRTVYATLGAVFPSVETWESVIGKDLVYLASKSPVTHDAARTRARAATEPYRTALAMVWGVGDAEGLYTGFVGNGDFAKDFRTAGAVPMNTDDRTVLEFELARSVGQATSVNIETEMRGLAAARGHARPAVVDGTIDWGVVDERRAARAIAEGRRPAPAPSDDAGVTARQAARRAYAAGDFAETRRQWLSQREEPAALGDLRMVAETFASGAHPRAPEYIEALRAWEPVEAEAVLSLWYQRTGNPGAAVDHLIEAFRAYRRHPWANRALFTRAYNEATKVLERDAGAAARVYEELRQPFAARALDITRLVTRASIGLGVDPERLCVDGLAPLEPNVPWDEWLLRERVECYRRAGNPRLAAAQADLGAFLGQKSPVGR